MGNNKANGAQKPPRDKLLLGNTYFFKPTTKVFPNLGNPPIFLHRFKP